ncbi:hypothetical protein [Gloeobacter morelensis]|uniref:Uncharacterized protein n=1 Tax=Gloeobacter morelensis MG652769 TaxID=2781736 RepID=A0ABY3PM98_9CYAN|nr:hypothetical protein [Gloeobacter morelensis]UFP94816.1 hypothetical protein ISF26_00775 [Gloeobacter morelensis MG652769]
MIKQIAVQLERSQSRPRRERLYNLQIVGCAAGMSVPLLACFTLFWVATTGEMPFFAEGAVPLVLLVAATAMGGWVWAQSIDLM